MAAAVERDSLLILSDACLSMILERLTLDDICSLSRTCNRLRPMCANHFRRKYPKMIHQKVQLCLSGNQTFGEYVKYFYNFIRNVEIVTDCVGDAEGKLRDSYRKKSLAVDFVREKCDREALHKISFDGDVELVAFGNEVKSFLHNVKAVEFKNRRYKSADEAKFLKLCPNMTKLVLGREMPALNVVAILQQNCQQLTHFNYMDGHATSLTSEKLELFFQRNSQIRSVAWCFRFNNDYQNSAHQHAMNCFKTLNYALGLQHLFLSINYEKLKDMFSDMCAYVESVLCYRDNFKRLEIAFERNYGAEALISCASQLSHIKKLAKIHLKNIVLGQVMPSVRLLGHLKTIVLNVSQQQCSDIDLVSLDVEEVQLETSPTNDTALSNRFVGLFVKKWINLQRILLPVTNCTLDIFDMNRDRQILTNARPVTIFTNYKNTNMNFHFVKIRFAEFRTGCDECPLQNHCMIRTN